MVVLIEAVSWMLTQFSSIVFVGALILFLTALPAAIQRDGTAAAGLGVCMLLFSL